MKITLEMLLLAVFAALVTGATIGKYVNDGQAKEAAEIGVEEKVKDLQYKYDVLLDRHAHLVQLALDLKIDDVPFRKDYVVNYASASKVLYGW